MNLNCELRRRQLPRSKRSLAWPANPEDDNRIAIDSINGPISPAVASFEEQLPQLETKLLRFRSKAIDQGILFESFYASVKCLFPAFSPLGRAFFDVGEDSQEVVLCSGQDLERIVHSLLPALRLDSNSAKNSSTGLPRSPFSKSPTEA